MTFPAFVHTVNRNVADGDWPVEGQGWNECGCTAASNAGNLVAHALRYRKDDFVREAGMFFQPQWGGTPSPVTSWLLHRHGFGTHFGNLQQTDYEAVIRDLIDRNIPVIVELGVVKMGNVPVSGQHSVVVVGYSEPFHDGKGQAHEEYYIVDAQWPALGQFSLKSNNWDFNNDGAVEEFPGNRTGCSLHGGGVLRGICVERIEEQFYVIGVDYLATKSLGVAGKVIVQADFHVGSQLRLNTALRFRQSGLFFNLQLARIGHLPAHFFA